MLHGQALQPEINAELNRGILRALQLRTVEVSMLWVHAGWVVLCVFE